MSMKKDFMAAYDAGSDAYRKTSSRWHDWVPVLVAVTATERVSSHYSLPWYYHVLALVAAFVAMVGLVAFVKRLVRAPKAASSPR